MSWEDPIAALMAECASTMAADAADYGGPVAPHVMGLKRGFEHGAPPRYVWVPSRGREDKTPVSRAVEEVPQIASFHQHFEIHCWGSSYAQTWAMVNNAYRAVSHALCADCRFENARWAHPSEAQNQKGELYVIELSVLVPIIDAYVDLTDLADPEAENVMPTSIEGSSSLTDDLSIDGEAGPDIDTD